MSIPLASPAGSIKAEHKSARSISIECGGTRPDPSFAAAPRGLDFDCLPAVATILTFSLSHLLTPEHPHHQLHILPRRPLVGLAAQQPPPMIRHHQWPPPEVEHPPPQRLQRRP